MRFLSTTGIILSHIPVEEGICVSDLIGILPYSERTIHYYLACLLELNVVTKKRKLKEDQRKWFYFRNINSKELKAFNMEIPEYEIIWDHKTLILIHSICKGRITVRQYKDGYRTLPREYQKDVLAAIKKHTCKKQKKKRR